MKHQYDRNRKIKKESKIQYGSTIQLERRKLHVKLKGSLNSKYDFLNLHKKEPKHAISYKRTNTTRCWDRKYYIIILINLCKILTAIDAAEIFVNKTF